MTFTRAALLARRRKIADSRRLSVLTVALILALSGLMAMYHPPGWERWAGWVFGIGLALALGLGILVAGFLARR